jgi:hypothetical protein
MGFTHYIWRPAEIDITAMKAIVADFKALVPELEKAGSPLAGWDGTGKAEITLDTVRFNGVRDCRHPKNDKIVIPWPSADAGGIADPARESAISGQWYGGVELKKRRCDGDCSFETFTFERKLKPEVWQKPDEEGRYLAFCKTAFRPYDLAVTCFLVIAKHHLGGRVRVSSDGEDCHWFDAKLVCQVNLGYGQKFAITKDGGLEKANGG